MARVFFGMVLSFPFPTPWVLITWGGVFSTQILTRLHTWALSNVSKTRVQNQINSKEEWRRRRVFFLFQRGDG